MAAVLKKAGADLLICGGIGAGAQQALDAMGIRLCAGVSGSSDAAVERFLPYVDNWATCDSMNAPVFRRHTAELLPHVKEWLRSDHPFTKRYAMGLLMAFYLAPDTFRLEYLEWVAAVRSEEYYVNMMVAWYFATALAKQWHAAVPYIEQHRLSPWCHNKAIQKSVESYRITPEQKQYLRGFREGSRRSGGNIS